MDRPARLGRYELLLELGRGGMAELWLARRSGVGGFEKLVAIKRILPHLVEDPQFRELFLNEGRIAARLSHPNVCQVHELDEADGELFLAMEYLDGVSWDQLARSAPRGEIGMRLSAAVIAQACEGLEYAHTLRDATGHATPIVHRDVSPQNLFVTVDGTCKVLDFGIAKSLRDVGPSQTRSGVLKGKPPYMAPEQVEGEPVDGRTDVWALGVCLWEALTGELLFDRETDFQIYKAITEDPVPSINAKVQRYPAALDAVIARALARDRDARYPSAKAFGAAVSSVVFPMSDAEIAGLVRSLCADRLARRQQEIAAVVSESRAASMAMRASTLPPAPDEPSAAETVDERRGVRVEEPASTATVSMAMRGESLVMPRARRRWPVIVAVAGAAITMIIVIVLAASSSSPSPIPSPDPIATPEPPPIATPTPTPIPAATPIAIPPHPIAPRPIAPHPPLVAKPPLDAPPAPRPDAPAADAPPAAPGTLSIDSEPYATIYVDGAALGDTPLFAKPIAAGKHELKAVLKDGRTRTIAIDVPAGGTLNQGKLAW